MPLTGASVNPARSLSAAVLAGGEVLSQVWVFIVAPLIGGALAAVVFRGLFSAKSQKKPRTEINQKLKQMPMNKTKGI